MSTISTVRSPRPQSGSGKLRRKKTGTCAGSEYGTWRKWFGNGCQNVGERREGVRARKEAARRKRISALR